MNVLGLPNLGATCWLNSILQCLLSCSPFVQWILHKEQWLPYYHKKNHVLEVIHHLFDDLHLPSANTHLHLPKANQHVNIDMKKIVVCLHMILQECKDRIVPGEQHDANDCLFVLLDKLHASVNTNTLHQKDFLSHPDKKPLYDWNHLLDWNLSPIHDIMYGQTCNEMRDVITGEYSVRYEPFSILYVPVPKKEVCPIFQLSDCFSLLTEETMMDQTSWMNKITLYKAPQVLIVSCMHPAQLEEGRFFVPSLELSVPVEDRLGKHPIEMKRYHLVACLYHLGNDQGGHYMAIVQRETQQREAKQRESEAKQSRWWRVDDTHVHEIPEDIMKRPMNYLPKLFFYTLRA